MVSMVRQYSIYTPDAVYSAWGHNPEEALKRVQDFFPEKRCSLTDDFDRTDQVNAQEDLIWHMLPYLMLLQRLCGSDGKFIAIGDDKGYTVDLNALGDLDKLINEITEDTHEADQTLESFLQSL